VSAEGPSKDPDDDGWPEPDAEKEIIQLMAGGDVALRVSNGPATSKGLPTDIFSELVKRAGSAIEEVGSMIRPPRLVGAYSGKSMVLVFADALDTAKQPELLEDHVRRSGVDIARLMAADDDELFSVAYGVGRGAGAYAELIHLAGAHDLTMEWKAGDGPVRRIGPRRAARQYERLTRQPETRARPLPIEGLLYRAIMDRPGTGTAGIKPTPGSSIPPTGSESKVIVRYESPKIEQQVLHELLGRMVRATVRIVEIDPESPSIVKPDLPYPVIEQIQASERPVTGDLFADDEATQA
jgi:hypothetical protein